MIHEIFTTEYWHDRILAAELAAKPHEALYACSLGYWQRLQSYQSDLLAQYVFPDDSILDIGCGWGRLLDILPKDWHGRYLGIDLSPDFVRIAQEKHPARQFLCHDLRQPIELDRQFDLAVAIAVREPILGVAHAEDDWRLVRRAALKHAKQLLLLGYDLDKGAELCSR